MAMPGQRSGSTPKASPSARHLTLDDQSIFLYSDIASIYSDDITAFRNNGKIAFYQIRFAGVGQCVSHNVDSVFHHIRAWRSEEHTSELQSLMRISYAVFCFKKKNNTRIT